MTQPAQQYERAALNRELMTADPHVVHPEVLLPLQFYGTLRRHAPNKTGEYRLLVAVLEDAIHSFQQHALARSRRGRRLFTEVERWLMHDSQPADRNTPHLSFEYICAVLGLDPAWLRQGLQHWRAAQLVQTPLPTPTRI